MLEYVCLLRGSHLNIHISLLPLVTQALLSPEMTIDEAPSFEHLVLDSGPLLTAHLHSSLSHSYYTVPEVISEIRDPASKAKLASLPFTLQTRIPSAEAYRRVWEFAKATGDVGTLSKTDLKVMALTLDLETECNGERERITPSSVSVHEGRPARIKDTSMGTITELPKESDSEGEWITPENLAQRKQRDLLGASSQPSAPATRIVACMTADFAMQNVLLQMRLHVASADGKRITCLKAWMLRCHACYWYTADMARKFCDKCGGPTLMRTSYALDTLGKPHFFLARNFRYNLRGTKYDMPMPEGGRKDDLITREDQREYIRAVKNQRRAEDKEFRAMINGVNVADVDDRLAGIFGDLSMASSAIATGIKKKSSSAMRSAPPVIIGTGRRNPNEVRGQRK